MNDLKSLEYIIVLFDDNAPSFCYYENPVTGAANSRQISLPYFEAIVQYVNTNGYKLTILHGEEELPEPYLNVLKSVEYATIKPFSNKDSNPSTTHTIDYDGDENVFKELKPGEGNNILLRLKSTFIPELKTIIKKYSNRFNRLTLFFTDIETFTEDKSEEYNSQLSDIKDILYEYYLTGNHIELNFLTDRMLLDQMNNCDAGIKHITFAPNGKFYLCPGFYYDNEDDTLGTLETGIEIKNSQLLALENAPICNICDAFHCKRCIYLNKKITLEINTPSRMQCILSHLERNVSKDLSDLLRKNPLFSNLHSIKEIDYLDPFDLIKLNPQLKRGWQLIDKNCDNDFEKMTDRELLITIYKMQRKIVDHLNIS
jgi:CXXX repeat peptide maturase